MRSRDRFTNSCFLSKNRKAKKNGFMAKKSSFIVQTMEVHYSQRTKLNQKNGEEEKRIVNNEKKSEDKWQK